MEESVLPNIARKYTIYMYLVAFLCGNPGVVIKPLLNIENYVRIFSANETCNKVN